MQAEDPFEILATLQRLPPVRKYIIALSGGLDSVALIHSLSQLQDQLPQSLLAVHIHHGLMADADLWTRQCESFCQKFKIPLEIVKVTVDRHGKSLEAAARQARYAALQKYVQADTALLTAHHQDDQAETILLHLIKGAGSAGLAGMPVSKPFGRGWHFRPLLSVSRKILREYVLQQKLSFIEDPSNLDTQHERNYLRHKIIPELKTRWPEAVSGMARSAQHQSDNLRLSKDLAEQDLKQIAEPDGALFIPRLKTLTEQRQKNCLRYWLRYLGGEDINPTANQLDSLMEELIDSSWDAEPELLLGKKIIHRYRDKLYQLPRREIFFKEKQIEWQLNRPLKIPAHGIYLEPWSVLAQHKNLSEKDKLIVRFRRGGEKIYSPEKKQHRQLKKLLQEWGVPPWRRSQIPLLYLGEELLIVWGYVSINQTNS